MFPQELFSLLTVNNIDFNGDVELIDDVILWSLKIDMPKNEEDFDIERELVEALEEDLEYINTLLEIYEEHMIDVDIDEIQIDENTAFTDLVIDELDVEEIEE